MFGKKTIVVPSTEKSATTYFKLLEVLTTKELRDFLRVKMSESQTGTFDLYLCARSP
jgi:hypothetical protein